MGAVTEGPRWVLLCECWDTAELQLTRAALESSGIPVRTIGEHTHGVLGAIDGAAQKPRILVPEQALRSARKLAEEIVGPFAEELLDDDDEHGSPFRRPAALESTQTGPPAARARSPRRRAVLGIIALSSLVFPVAGAGHVYVGFASRGAVLWALSIGAQYLILTGGWRYIWLLFAVVIVDLIGALGHAATINRELERATPDDDDDEPPAELSPSSDGFED